MHSPVCFDYSVPLHSLFPIISSYNTHLEWSQSIKLFKSIHFLHLNHSVHQLVYLLSHPPFLQSQSAGTSGLSSGVTLRPICALHPYGYRLLLQIYSDGLNQAFILSNQILQQVRICSYCPSVHIPVYTFVLNRFYVFFSTVACL